jgi:lysophospholipase L1-like esterase
MDYFERNIRRIVHLARSHDIDVILPTPPSSLELLYAPTATSSRGYWILDAATTQRYRASPAARMWLVGRSVDSAGNDVPYVATSLEPQHFLDDCHLSSDGNRALANVFAQAVATHIQRWLASGSGAVRRQ